MILVNFLKYSFWLVVVLFSYGSLQPGCVLKRDTVKFVKGLVVDKIRDAIIEHKRICGSYPSSLEKLFLNHSACIIEFKHFKEHKDYFANVAKKYSIQYKTDGNSFSIIYVNEVRKKLVYTNEINRPQIYNFSYLAYLPNLITLEEPIKTEIMKHYF